jgi:hypothetical protein
VKRFFFVQQKVLLSVVEKENKPINFIAKKLTKKKRKIPKKKKNCR